MSNWSFVFIVLTALISIGFPIVMIKHLKKRYHASLSYLISGVVVFTVTQLFLRIPLLQWFSGQIWFKTYIEQNRIVYIIVLSLSAGIFEELGRYLAFKFLHVDKREWENGLMFGIGHGGAESIALVGVNYLGFILIALSLNFGLFENLVAMIPNVDQIIELLRGTSAITFLIAGIERLFTMIIHMGLSLCVLESVRIGKIRGLYMAIGLHTMVNALALFLSSFNLWLAEIPVAIGAIVSLLYIYKKKKMWKFVI